MKREYKHLDSLTDALDSKDTERVLSFLTEDCLFQAGNTPVVKGKKQIGEVFNSFFPQVSSISHQITDVFEFCNTLVHMGIVVYTRLDGSRLKVPFCDIFKVQNGLINEYYIYIDWSNL
ncbi:nuclear transport factor 2 family protein [Cytophaga sp. FL35]|uniref:nuclear transport factor 2 family protein n=1 Tax=Cytophaga sp. FL35 TaxID=1904456 RepID=UPI0016538E69|nr:nuclear transport factor 2 family protein [Cytophaga sp. FL35]MBC6999823.1 nuclear transport factor 2 family protein [Cytophaga sp. FL35]